MFDLNINWAIVSAVLCFTNAVFLVWRHNTWLKKRHWENVANKALEQASRNLGEPIEVWCDLHGSLSGYIAKVCIDRNGIISAPQNENARVLQKKIIPTPPYGYLGAPDWETLKKPMKSLRRFPSSNGIDYIVLNMLEATYYMSHNDVNASKQ